jgi:hypothetical protein
MNIKIGNYEVSVIDDGYGSSKGLFEIAVFKDNAFVTEQFIDCDGDQVKGWLTWEQVNDIIELVKKAS